MNFEAGRDRWQVVADAMRDRREELGITQQEAIQRSEARVSSSTWSNLERAAKTSYERSKLRAVCRALGWSSDSIERIIAGQEPSPLEADDVVTALRQRRVEEVATRDSLRDVLHELQGLRRDVASLLSRIEAIERAQ